MAQALLDNIIFARKEDMTDAAGSPHNFNNILGFWTSEQLELVYRDYLNFPGGMSFTAYSESLPAAKKIIYGVEPEEGEDVIPMTGDELAVGDSQDDPFSTQDAKAEEAKESQHSSVFGSQSQTSAFGSQSQEEDVSAANPSKFAIIPRSLTYLAEIIEPRIEEKKHKFMTTPRENLVKTIQEQIQELEDNQEGWQFTNPDPPVPSHLLRSRRMLYLIQVRRQVGTELIPVETLEDLM